MKRTILIPAIIWVSALTLTAQNYNKNNDSQSEKFKNALKTEILASTNDADNVERVLVEIKNYETVTNHKVVSETEWNHFQQEISTLEKSLSNKNIVRNEEDKLYTEEKIAFLKNNIVKLSDIKTKLSTLKN